MELGLSSLEISDHVNCFVCGQIILKREVLEEGFEVVDCIGEGFMALFKLFEIKLTKKNLGLWNDKEESVFCDVCQNQIAQLIQLWKQLEEIKLRLEEGKEDLKNKLESSEGTFESGVYQRDGRYVEARKLILGRRDEQYQMRGRKPLTSKFSLRKSARNSEKAKTRSKIRIINPQVSLSVNKKFAEDEYTSLIAIKSEEVETVPITTDYLCDKISSKNETSNKPKQSKRVTTKSQKRKSTISDIDEDWKPSKEEKRRHRRSSLKEGSSITSISSHAQNEDSDSPNKGSTTNLKFDKITGTCSHLNVTLDKIGNEYKCRLCKTFLPNSKRDLRYHIIREHSNLTTCKHCGKKFNIVSRLQSHVKQSHEAGPTPQYPLFTCPICSKPVKTRTKFLIHKWTHYNAQERLEAVSRGEKDPNLKPIQCDTCGNQFPSKFQLRRHVSFKHPTPGDTYRKKKVCPQCGREVYNLEIHIKRHQDDGAQLWFSCCLCSKGFTSRERLTRHKKCHELAYKCTMCDKAFSKKNLLEQHINLHLGIRPYKCPHCEASFTAEMHLNKHVKIYHGEGANPKRKFL